MDELIKKLELQHGEELGDYDTYVELSEEAENCGMYKAAGILRDIAHEERSHAKLLACILRKEA